MKRLYIVETIIACIFFCVSCGSVSNTNIGSISGSVLPEEAFVRIIAKTAGTEYEDENNIKGEITLTNGGDFIIEGLPAGKYDLLFFLQEESASTYLSTHWSEIVVKPGANTAGINYRLTPQGSEYLIDEVIVGFNPDTSAENAQMLISSLGCTIKSPIDLNQSIFYVVDIPNDKSVDDMIMLFTTQDTVLYAEPNRIMTAQDF